MEMHVCNDIDNIIYNNTVSAEDTFVDDFLDFSKVETDDEFGVCTKIEETTTFQLSSLHVENLDSSPVPLHETQLCLPEDEQANLEWLSNFVDDSTPGYSLTIPVENIRVKPDQKLSVKENCSVTFCVKTKARSKRVRKGVRVWSLNDSATSSSSSCSPINQLGLHNDVTHLAESFKKPLIKKQKQKQQLNGGEPRRCSHCLVQKTPQWRAGPNGAKTLCNACGVRYKSGRLLPEYRPAISPTFSSEKHSNNHRKVMEMRRKKGDTGFVIPVESF